MKFGDKRNEEKYPDWHKIGEIIYHQIHPYDHIEKIWYEAWIEYWQKY